MHGLGPGDAPRYDPVLAIVRSLDRDLLEEAIVEREGAVELLSELSDRHLRREDLADPEVLAECTKDVVMERIRGMREGVADRRIEGPAYELGDCRMTRSGQHVLQVFD
jgi:hypothetical protein